MKRPFALLIFAVTTAIGIATLSSAAGSNLVEGSILKIEGDFYTVHDTAGHEVRLPVDKTMHLEGGAFKPGARLRPM